MASLTKKESRAERIANFSRSIKVSNLPRNLDTAKWQIFLSRVPGCKSSRIVTGYALGAKGLRNKTEKMSIKPDVKPTETEVIEIVGHGVVQVRASHHIEARLFLEKQVFCDHQLSLKPLVEWSRKKAATASTAPLNAPTEPASMRIERVLSRIGPTAHGASPTVSTRPAVVHRNQQREHDERLDAFLATLSDDKRSGDTNEKVSSDSDAEIAMRTNDDSDDDSEDLAGALSPLGSSSSEGDLGVDRLIQQLQNLREDVTETQEGIYERARDKIEEQLNRPEKNRLENIGAIVVVNESEMQMKVALEAYLETVRMQEEFLRKELGSGSGK